MRRKLQRLVTLKKEESPKKVFFTGKDPSSVLIRSMQQVKESKNKMGLNPGITFKDKYLAYYQSTVPQKDRILKVQSNSLSQSRNARTLNQSFETVSTITESLNPYENIYVPEIPSPPLQTKVPTSKRKTSRKKKDVLPNISSILLSRSDSFITWKYKFYLAKSTSIS